MPRTKPSVVLPLLLVLLTGCEKTPPPALIASDKLCKDWRHKTINSRDRLTEETASQLEADNKSRPQWGCKYGENEAEASKS